MSKALCACLLDRSMTSPIECAFGLQHSAFGIRHFSGTAVARIDLDGPGTRAGRLFGLGIQTLARKFLRATFAAWARRAPRRFEFAVKASRFLTHMKKLKEPEEPLERLFSRMQALGRHLGPVLYQLPPGWKLNLDRLRYFLDALPRRARHVMEFRDPTWYDREVCHLLDRRGVALCLHDMPGSATARERVGPFVYVRFHGATSKYGGGYAVDRLRSWAEWLNAQRDGSSDVYAYFNNDVGGHAPRDAVTLRRLLEVG